MNKTALYNQHVALGAKIVEFAGFEMPIVYSSITEEHNSVRNNCGIFDVSHMGEICIKGKEATKFVDHIFTNDVASMVDNQVLYGMMLYPTGGVVDDLLVYKFNNEHYLLVVNASNVDKDFEWIVENNTFDCKASNESGNFSEVALQGPKAEEVLQKLTDFDLNEITFFTHQNVKIDGKLCLVSRTGYTGEDGFEIYGTHSDIVELWDLLLETGGEDILPIGLGARDTLRFEVNLPLYGHELTKDITPLEAGYSFAVKLEAADFIGKDVLVAQKAAKTTRRIVGLEMLDKGIMREGYDVYHEDTLVGFITTGYKSPSTGKTVALAMIDRPYDKLGTNLEVEIRNKRKKVVVIKKKFYSKKYKK
jgi:aminomethyltransferase